MSKPALNPVHVIGGGLAGSEAAWQIARAGSPVVLHEMRPVRATEAHLTGGLAELVCSNSFRSDDAANNAVGLLHEEMRRLGSLIMTAGDAHKVPAGAHSRAEPARFLMNFLTGQPAFRSIQTAPSPSSRRQASPTISGSEPKS